LIQLVNYTIKVFWAMSLPELDYADIYDIEGFIELDMDVE
jgi:hypothetical protein